MHKLPKISQIVSDRDSKPRACVPESCGLTQPALLRLTPQGSRGSTSMKPVRASDEVHKGQASLCSVMSRIEALTCLFTLIWKVKWNVRAPLLWGSFPLDFSSEGYQGIPSPLLRQLFLQLPFFVPPNLVPNSRLPMLATLVL